MFCTPRYGAARKRKHSGQGDGDGRRVLRTSTRRGKGKRALQCMQRGDKERRSVETVRPKSDIRRIAKSSETELHERRRRQAQTGPEGLCVGVLVSARWCVSVVCWCDGVF